MVFSVFYAWQSDLPNRTNRSLIKNAIRNAIDALHADAQIEERPVLDHDTKDVPGVPDIANTILKKIDDCGIFIADLTFMGRSTGSGESPKLLPNPNVLIELGYALKSVGPERIITIMNTAYGDPTELPFDLRHRRFPISYRMVGDDACADVLRELSVRIESAIRAVVESGILSGRVAKQTAQLEEVIDTQRTAFESRTISGQFRNMKPGPGLTAITIMPADARPGALDFSKVGERVQHHQVLARCDWNYASYSMWAHRRSWRGHTVSAVELSDACVLSYADLDLVTTDFSGLDGYERDRLRAEKINGFVSDISFERELHEIVCRAIGLLDQMPVKRPFLVGISLLNLDRFILYRGPRDTEQSRIVQNPLLKLRPVLVPEAKDLSNPLEVARLLQPSFDAIWQEFGYQKSHNYDSTGLWRPPQ